MIGGGSSRQGKRPTGVRVLTVAIAVCAVLAAWLAGFSGSAVAKVVHEREGTFPISNFNWLSIDNSGGPSAGDLYIGELKPAGFVSRVYQTDHSGTATGLELDGAETPAGSFGFVNTSTFRVSGGPAVDGSSGPKGGDIYVPDVLHGVVDLFDESGHYVCQITGQASPSPSECAGASGSQTPRGEIEPLAVAVDPANGALVVGDASGVLYEFNEAGEYEAEIADSHITQPGSLAVDSVGDVYVVNESPFSGPGEAVKFSPAGSFEYALASSRLSAGVDFGNNHVYLGGQEGQIEEFDSTGKPVSTFGGGARSVGVSRATGQVFVTPPFGEEGQIWSGDLFVPSVTTGPATEVAETTVTLNGDVDPEISEGGSQVESCRFEYIDQAGFEASEWAGAQTAACSPPTPYSSATVVSTAVSGLLPSTTYHYRLVAVNADGHQGEGEGRTFITFGPPSISGEVSIARTESATVKAQINPFGSETTCEVDYVDQAGFEASGYAGAASVPCAEALPAGFGAQIATAQLVGLKIGTTYHFRFVAHNGASSNGGTTVGNDQVFSTFGIESFSIEALDREGNPYTQAGGHPYELKVVIALDTTATVGTPPPGQVGNLESVSANPKTVQVSLPPGLIGNPMATPKCEPFEIKPQDCAADTQVGHAVVQSARGTSDQGPVFNLVPPTGVAAQLGGRFNTIGTVRINANVRTGSDYGVDTGTMSITADEGVKRVEMAIWGVPADEGHFLERFCPEVLIAGCASGAPLRPFLTNPTSCAGPSAANLSVDTWQDPGDFVSALSPMPANGGCNRLDFQPTIRVQPDTSVADSPTGLHVDLHVPQNENPVGLAEANLKGAIVALPPGLVVDPASANGLAGCSPAQIELHGPEPARCPDASKVGSVEVDTPLLDHPIKGGVYVAQQGNAGAAHGANPFGSLLAIYIAVDDPQSGVVVKLAGHVEANRQTGQLTTTFSENPQLPFEDFKLDFFGGPHAPLSTPVACGAYATTTRLTPWSTPEGADALPSDSFPVGAAPGGGTCATSGAQLPNTPSFEAGTQTPLAGAFSPFVLHLSRPDGSQRLSAIDATLPEGLVGRLKGIPYCSEAAIRQAEARNRPGDGSLERGAPSCPAASQVGSVDVAAGAGPSPYHVQGAAYLAGPYEGGPLSLVIVTPAVAGPFDLGAVVVRTALYVNPATAQITARSDPLPTMLEGIPLDVRSITVKMDRPEFTLNPTSCDPLAVGGQAISVTGQAASLASRFQVGSCERLPLKPKLSLHVFGKTNRNAKPRLRAVLTMKPGEANIARAQVNLPHSEFIEQNHIKTVCTRVQFAQGDGHGSACPPGSVYGHATAFTPLLDQPLQGPVYLRSSSHKLPDLVAALNGQVDIELDGKVDSGPNEGIRNTFEVVPDAPVSKFVLEMKGGKKGLLVNSENLCSPKAKTHAIAHFVGQNGKVYNPKPKVENDCGKGKGSGKKHRSHGRRASRRGSR
jgi:hypothetical protein